MISGRGFHPDLRRIAIVAPRGGPATNLSLQMMRRLMVLRSPRAVGVHTVDLGAGAGLRLFGALDAGDPAPALLWMHGGGYVAGSARLDDALCRALAHSLGITVASVEYRLAPEHPYPAALDDCTRAWHHLAQLPAVDSGQIAIGGVSSGAGLAAALAFRLRDESDLQPVLQLLSYPMIDDESSAATHLNADRFRFWNQKSNAFSWNAYLGRADRSIAVPSRRTDLAGLPPAWIGVGALDLFCAEDVAYARRLRSAGVPCELHVVDGAFHGFDAVAPKSLVAQSFFTRQCISLHDAFQGRKVQR